MLVSCGLHKDVRPGTEIHRVAIASEDSEEGARDCLEQANHYCEQFEKHTVIVSEGKKDVGPVEEDTYKKTKMVTRAVETVGRIGEIRTTFYIL